MAEQMIRPSLQPGFLPVEVQSRDGTPDPAETARLTSQNVLFGTAQGQDPTFLGRSVNDLYAQFGDEGTASTIRAAQRANELEVRDPLDALYEAASRNQGTPELQRPWSRASLDHPDQELYDAYVDIIGEPSRTWVDGSPRNPMPQVRDQLYGDFVKAMGHGPMTEEADGSPRDPRPEVAAWAREEAQRRNRQTEDPDPFRFSAAPPTVNREHGGIAGLAARGRGGDSMLVHMAPEEVAGLASLVPDGVTINPDTGLPEMFKLRDIMPAIIAIGANAIPGIGPFASAALAAAGSFAFGKGKPEEKILPALLAGATSYGMGQLTGRVGAAGAQEAGKLAGTADFTGTGTIGETLLTPTGDAAIPWSELQTQSPEAFEMLSRAGVNTEQLYNQTMQKMGSALRAGMPTGSQLVGMDVFPRQVPGTITSGGMDVFGRQVPGTITSGPMSVPVDRLTNLPVKPSLASKPTYAGTNRFGDPFREVAASKVLNPPLVPSDAARAYKAAWPLDRLGYIKGGLGQIDPAWYPTAPGRVGLGDLAGPAAAAMAGIPSLLPPPEYEALPGRPRYEDKGPYFPDERVRRQTPFGYRPGIDEQHRYFAAGTRGKTVYAQDGYDAMGGVDRGIDSPSADSSSSQNDLYGGLLSREMNRVAPPGHSAAYITPQEALQLRASGGGVSPGGGQYMANGIPSFQESGGVDPGISESTGPTGGLGSAGGQQGSSPSAPSQADSHGYTFADFPPPEMRSIEQAVMDDRAAEQDQQSLMGFFREPSFPRAVSVAKGAFDFGVPQAVISDPRTGAVSIGSALNVPGALAGIVGLGLGPLGGLLATPAKEAAKSYGYNPSVTSLFAAKEEEEKSLDQYDDYLATSANQEGTQGVVLGDTVEENIDVETATEMPAGVAATSGIMQGAPMEVQGDVETRLQERQVEEPQNPRERAIYDRAVLALQNELEPEVAQRAVDDFLELFGPDALHMLQEMVRGEREGGGIVETASGETTLEEGGIQGPDVIPGKIVDPVTGEVTANLRVGENEYIEPAVSLVRRAKVAGLPPTPENGAMIRGQEEEMLRQAVG